ncbi:molybdopterin biosynthesis protein [Candidatus Desantisbacteria bacterium CG_4_8_14_3_um_filter_40_12]|uniref:Molybdopterin molybdenumtransferase n=2 Tax=unclassified Candidatus Desantisiibacteriota TaxID=3106372 RepID=A0A2M7JDW8_9BACT|nr:MAG: molybdopterin biosynthesis protein [Candidatus Desantisbacteria bacterium CG_4_8_14_3_um_filter_40_12]PIY19624.1 MAG: molybdopterin biosynthesis protein [Candidatus Desantisbacteria bacterium CG_4_10_14_3_um_filter_40_18]
MKRNIYLMMKPLEEARNIWQARCGNLKIDKELLAVERSMSRITAEPVIARICSPSYHSAAMDGIAVRAESLINASETTPRCLILNNDAVLINTGNPLPHEMDAVIKIEDVCMQSEGISSLQSVEIMTPVVPYQHVRMVGEDIIAGEMILTINHSIRPQDIGAMLAGGVIKIWVKKKPQVIIIPTGDELVPLGEPLKRGQIIEFNSSILKAMVEEWGGEAIIHKIVPDDYQMIKDAVKEAVAKADIVLINAGSSAGSKDYTPQIIRELGELVVHGVTMMPGKPVALGIIAEKPVVGIPGYPVSAMLAMEEFVMPVICQSLSMKEKQREKIQAVITQKIASRLGLEEFVRVGVGYFPKRDIPFVAVPQRQGAGIITSMVKADGILRIPRLCEGLEEGSKVDVELLRTKTMIESNVILIGSHDNLLDILANCLCKQYPQMSLCVTNVGSLGGLLSLRRGDCHLTTCHLLDEDTGEYNLPYIKRFLHGMDVSIITLAWREQGLIIQKGNPKNIHVLTDLIRDDIVFINRQKGAGTRILLDYKLKKAGILSNNIRGYETEVFTHMAVCAAIEAGTADTGLGIMASAGVFDMDFIPLTRERYDLVIPGENLSLPGISALLEIINSLEFRIQIASLKGYDLNECGREHGFTSSHSVSLSLLPH